jgi:hypothetical protein
MFVSYNYKKRVYSKDRYEYELIDSEFQTVVLVATANSLSTAVIQEYSKRNLNVAANLVLAFVWMNKHYPGWSIREMINYSKHHNPLFEQYEKDLQKYLVLL